MESNTAKNFALQLGSLIALYVSLSAAIALLFGVINIAYPDAAEGYWVYDSAQNSIRFGIAALLVFFPAYLLLTRMVNVTRRKESGAYLTLTKWMIYLSLLLGGGIVLGDLVAVILAYLNGEITTRFILKALVLFVIIGFGLVYYVLDAKGYWQREEKKSLTYAAGASIVLIVVLILGFYFSDSPSVIRERRIDDRQVSDLQEMQWRIEEYYRVEGALPDTADALYNGIAVPEAPEERSDYAYTILGETRYALCAEFAQESRPNGVEMRPVSIESSFAKNPVTWDHGTGEWCFERVVVAEQ